MKETVNIEGKILDRTEEWKPNRYMHNFAVVYATVECPGTVEGKDGTHCPAFYTFRVSSVAQARKISIGAQIRCTVRRKSKIWEQGGEWKLKDATEWFDKERVAVGKVPIIIENYELVGEITVYGVQDACLDTTGGDDDLPF